MCHLISISQLVNCCCRISSADDCYSVCVCKCFCNRFCSFCKFRHLEASHWSVPYNCLSIFYCIAEDLSCLWSDVESFPSFRDLSSFYYLSICIIREIISDNVIYRKKEFYTFGFCFFNHVKCILAVIFFQKGFSDCSALCFCECICHSSTDDQSIYFVKKVLNYRNLA